MDAVSIETARAKAAAGTNSSLKWQMDTFIRATCGNAVAKRKRTRDGNACHLERTTIKYDRRS